MPAITDCLHSQPLVGRRLPVLRSSGSSRDFRAPRCLHLRMITGRYGSRQPLASGQVAYRRSSSSILRASETRDRNMLLSANSMWVYVGLALHVCANLPMVILLVILAMFSNR